MAFHEVRFSLRIAYGSRGGPGFSTSVIEQASGRTTRVSRWQSPKYRFDVAPGIRDRADMSEILSFYLARKGVGNGFRFFDHQDHTTAENGRDAPAFDDVLLGTGDGATTTFQLKKVYASGAETTTRNIYKPIHGETLGAPVAETFNVLIGLAGVPQGSGWSVNTTDGIVTFTAAPGVGVAVTAGCAFDVPVAFGAELDAALQAEHTNFDVMSVDTVVLEELREPVAVYEELNYGGYYEHGEISATTAITTLQGRFHGWLDNTGQIVRLPNLAVTPEGGPLFFLLNRGSTTTQIQTHDGLTNVVTCPSGTLVTLLVALDAVLAKVWVAF